MKIFVFGAGASHSAHTQTKAKRLRTDQIPPLTRDLLNGKYYAYAKEIGLTLNDRDEWEDETVEFDNLEEWLTAKWKDANTQKSGLTRDAHLRELAKITFFIWITLLRISECVYQNTSECRGDNMYRSLLKKLKSEESFGIVNFNYDLLLDIAFKDVFSVMFQNINDYLKVNYIKPHGSVNWFLDRRQEDRVLNFEQKFDFDTQVRIDAAIENMYKDIPFKFDGHKIMEPTDRNLYKIDNILREFDSQYFYPLVFLPIRPKNYAIISNFEAVVINKAKEIFSQASEVYFIGYRAGDEIILGLFKYIPTSCTRIHVVNTQNSSEIIAKSLYDRIGNAKLRICIWNNGFQDFVRSY